ERAGFDSEQPIKSGVVTAGFPRRTKSKSVCPANKRDAGRIIKRFVSEQSAVARRGGGQPEPCETANEVIRTLGMCNANHARCNSATRLGRQYTFTRDPPHTARRIQKRSGRRRVEFGVPPL